MQYDYQSIEKSIYFLQDEKLQWEGFFASTGIDHHKIIYEDFQDDPIHGVKEICNFLGIQGMPQIEDGTEILRDELSEEWKARFQKESRKVYSL